MSKVEKDLVQNDLLRNLLDAEDRPQAQVEMKRFGLFTIQALDGDVIDKLQERCTYYTGKGKNRKKVVDEQKFGALIINEACVEPKWTHPELLKKYDTQDPADVIRKRLLAGEIVKLSAEIMQLSGFEDDEEDAIEEVKN